MPTLCYLELSVPDGYVISSVTDRHADGRRYDHSVAPAQTYADWVTCDDVTVAGVQDEPDTSGGVLRARYEYRIPGGVLSTSETQPIP